VVVPADFLDELGVTSFGVVQVHRQH
jgi:hypothetical protein